MKKLLITLILIQLAVAAIYFSTFTVDEKDWIIVTQFGKPVRIVKDAGLYIKRPGFLQKINKFDKRTRIFETEPIQLLLGDKNPIIIECYIAWKIKDPLMFFQTIGYDNINGERKVGDILNSQLGIVFGDYKIENIINTEKDKVKLSEIEERIRTNSTENSETKYGITISKIGVQRISYPSIVVNAVYDRMKSERNKEAEKLKAEGKEVADKIRSDATLEASTIKSEAEKKALIIKGEGEKEAMQIYTKAYKEDPEFFYFLNSLETYKKVLNENTTLILSTKSELFKYLDLDQKKEK